MLENRRPRPRVRVDLAALDRVLAAQGCETDEARAEFLDVAPSALSKLRRGLQDPSAQLIASIRLALPRVPYEALFWEERS